MNIVVLSPRNRGTGVTSVAYTLAIELKHRGEFVQIMDINKNRPSLMNLYKSIRGNEKEEVVGITNLSQLVRTGTLSAEDMTNCAVDLGVNAVCITPNTTDKEIMEIVSLTRSCQIGGRELYTIIDMNLENDTCELFREIIKNANLCVFVLTQDIEHINNTNNCRQLNDKALREHGINTCYVINRYEECGLQIKDIWKMMNIKDTKCWFKIRYCRALMMTKSKSLFISYSKALHDSLDPDTAKIKTDISRIANYALKQQRG